MSYAVSFILDRRLADDPPPPTPHPLPPESTRSRHQLHTARPVRPRPSPPALPAQPRTPLHHTSPCLNLRITFSLRSQLPLHRQPSRHCSPLPGPQDQHVSFALLLTRQRIWQTFVCCHFCTMLLLLLLSLALQLHLCLAALCRHACSALSCCVLEFRNHFFVIIDFNTT